MNIARVMRCMGEACALYSFLGGANGRAIEREMEEYGVELHAVWRKEETRTTINVIDRKSRIETEITEPGPSLELQEEEAFLKMLEREVEAGDIVICSGLPMNGMRADIYRRISQICETKRAKCMLDANRQYLKGAFPGRYYFGKPNLDELSRLFDTDVPEREEEIVALGERLLEQGVENLLISLGSRGGLFLNSRKAFRIWVPQVEIVSTIGSGDASVAGFCIGAVRGLTEEGSARLAMACGVCNAEFSKVGYVERELVERLAEEMEIAEICLEEG